MSSLTVTQQLVAAVEEDNVANLREILSQKHNNGRCFVASQGDIDRALRVAAGIGNVEACRLLYNRLNSREKKKYKVGHIESLDSNILQAAEHGHIEVLRLFVEEFKVNVNQLNGRDETPLLHATRHNRLEASRLLLENGADPKLGCYIDWEGELCNCPLYDHLAYNVYENPAVVRLLLEYGADPNVLRRPAHVEDVEDVEDAENHFPPNNLLRCTDLAIYRGWGEILQVLLRAGAFVGGRTNICPDTGTSLNQLLKMLRGPNSLNTRERKLSICRILVEHAQTDNDTASFLQYSLKHEIKRDDDPENEQIRQENLEVLLEGGVEPTSRGLIAAIQVGKEWACRLLVRRGGADPFLEVEGGDNDDNYDHREHAPSPFQEAARQEETGIISFFLGVWDERFSTNNGKNNDGDYPIHVLCCDPKVSLKAIELVAARQPDTLATVDGEQGLFPFHFAAMWDAKLDVTYHLVRHSDALFRLLQDRNDPPFSAAAAAAAERSGGSDDAMEGKQDHKHEQQVESTSSGPVKKKAKTTV